MRITHSEFDRSLDEILGDASRASLRFEDGTDVYKIRLQRLAGAGRGLAECYCTLNAEDAVQVDTMPALSRTIGSILLDIASAPKGSTAAEFFAPEGAPSEPWSVGGEGDVRETPLLRKLFQEDEEQRVAMRSSGMAPG